MFTIRKWNAWRTPWYFKQADVLAINQQLRLSSIYLARVPMTTFSIAARYPSISKIIIPKDVHFDQKWTQRLCIQKVFSVQFGEDHQMVNTKSCNGLCYKRIHLFTLDMMDKSVLEVIKWVHFVLLSFSYRQAILWKRCFSESLVMTLVPLYSSRPTITTSNSNF